MQELDDNALLREYVERDSEEAFAALVTRHVNKVYSVALRHTGNPHSAEEITQAVFVILARKSRQLGKRVILSGWLYQTARLTAVTFIRGGIRRARREQEAYMQTVLNENESDAWTQIAPLLDAAMAGLNEADRHAVVLRFFDGKSLREVGAALGANEEAAKKRVSRALEKLRAFFAKRGVSSTAAIIAGAISANSVQAAPVALAKSVTAVALAKGATAGGSTLTLIKGALKIMAWTKAKTAMVVTAVAILTASTTTTLVIQHRHHHFPRSSWAYAGYASPESAFQSSVWAISKGDAQTWLASLTPTLQTEVNQRAAGDDDKIISADDKRDFARITGYRILGRQDLSKDEVVLEVYAEGLNQIQKCSMERTGGEWKFGGKAK
jgi:RNA polymerase sigma factor (sigma-70 family)